MSVLAALLLAQTAAVPAQAPSLTVASPNGEVQVVVGSNAQNQPTYSVSYRGRPVLTPSALGLDVDKGGQLSYGLQATRSTRGSGDRTYRLLGKASAPRDHYNELIVDYADAGGRTLQIAFRAYDDGAAFRYRLPAQKALEAVNIHNEMTRFNFAADYQCWGVNFGKFGTSHEGEYDPIRSSLIREHSLFDAPLVCKTGEGRTTFAIAEADLRDYAGMYLQGGGAPGAQVKLSPRPEDQYVAVRTRIGSDVYSPWRVVMIAPEPAKLIESTLITDLNPDPSFDASWVKPGKAAWDWWNGPTLDGRQVVLNNDTYRRFIDFAASQGFEYMMIDEGWYVGAGGGGTVRPGVDITRTVPEIDIPALVEYGRARGVGLLLWLNWKAFDVQMDQSLALYQKWGIKGVKIDFMDRDDQPMVEWYHRVLSKAAQHKLLVNFHGAYHPTGLIRTYPNYLTQEGVMGAEYNKWSTRVTPTHNVTLPFTRMLLGPMDYTPGGFGNRTPETFEIRNAPPLVQTTRGQALAMYVVYESPLAIVADTPDNYKGQPGLEFISRVPTVWDETRAIGGDIGEFVVLARRKGKDWYVGAMTNEQGRTVELPLSFLGAGRYAATSWTDGATPTDLKIDRWNLSRGERAPLTLRLAPSGGAAVHFKAQ